jgi:uncharacterized membrane protein YoaK (UPF0700 family)
MRGPGARPQAPRGQDPPHGSPSARSADIVRTLLVIVLAAGTGSFDALSFLALGGVFASVITGNVVILGIGMGKLEGAMALRAGVATAGYACGVAAGVAIVGRVVPRQAFWPRRVTTGLLVELVVIGAFAVGWELTAARPGAAATVILLGAGGGAMGMQSAVVNRLDLPGFTSTFLTSTLIRAVTDLVAAPRDHLTAKLSVIVAAVAGAACGALLVSSARRLAPVIVIATVATVALAGWALARDGRLLAQPVSDR